MKRVICTACEGEGDFRVRNVRNIWGLHRSVTIEFVDCDDCRGLGWVNPPEEDEEEDEDEDRN